MQIDFEPSWTCSHTGPRIIAWNPHIHWNLLMSTNASEKHENSAMNLLFWSDNQQTRQGCQIKIYVHSQTRSDIPPPLFDCLDSSLPYYKSDETQRQMYIVHHGWLPLWYAWIKIFMVWLSKKWRLFILWCT